MPKVTIIVEGGVIQDVIIENGLVEVESRDYDVPPEDRGGMGTRQDEHGDWYALGEWS